MSDQDIDEAYQVGIEQVPRTSRWQGGEHGLMDTPLPEKPWKAARSVIVALLIVTGLVVVMGGIALSFFSYPCGGPGAIALCQASSWVGGPVFVSIEWGNSAHFTGELTILTCSGWNCTQVFSSGAGNGSFSVWVPNQGIVVVNSPASFRVFLSSTAPADGLPLFVIGGTLVGAGLLVRRFRRRMSEVELAHDLT